MKINPTSYQSLQNDYFPGILGWMTTWTRLELCPDSITPVIHWGNKDVARYDFMSFATDIHRKDIQLI